MEKCKERKVVENDLFPILSVGIFVLKFNTCAWKSNFSPPYISRYFARTQSFPVAYTYGAYLTFFFG